MTNLPRIRTQYGEGVGIELFIEFPDISRNEKTYFDSDEAAAQTALSANGVNFAVGQYVVLGQPFMEKAEIVKLHASTPPTSSTITTAAAIAFAHSRGELIRFIPYNQIVVERSTDAGVNFTPLTAIDIRADARETYLQRPSDASTDVYRFRFYNSADNVYSAYSDQVTASGLADNTVGAIKQRALDDLGEDKSDLITDKFLNQSLWAARRELDESEEVLRWSFRTKFNQDIGDCIAGRWRLAVPADLRDPNTNKNILSLRIGRVGYPLDYLDVNQFFQRYQNVAHSTLASQITAVSTSVVLTSSGDFDESGSIVVAAEDITESMDTVEYTGNTESTATLSGATLIGTTHAAGRDVWQGATFGTPVYYTIFEGYIYFDVPFSDDIAGENIFMDYYSTLLVYNSDSDVLDEPETDLFVSYLRWRIKYKKSNGTLNAKEDTDWQEWTRKKKVMINKQITGQRIRLVPS